LSERAWTSNGLHWGNAILIQGQVTTSLVSRPSGCPSSLGPSPIAFEFDGESSKKNYALWLYYHRLDKDILFKARQNYVEPKIRLEQTRLDSLRSQKTALGAAAKGAKKIDKDIERQEALIAELKDFAEKLERAAKLNFGNPEKLDSDVVYDPDLNDGVVLTISPLWELVPWKEAKNYWEELLEGKYEWSSMGKLLRQKGLVK
jgi:hypothetical protein